MPCTESNRDCPGKRVVRVYCLEDEREYEGSVADVVAFIKTDAFAKQPTKERGHADTVTRLAAICDTAEADVSASFLSYLGADFRRLYRARGALGELWLNAHHPAGEV